MDEKPSTSIKKHNNPPFNIYKQNLNPWQVLQQISWMNSNYKPSAPTHQTTLMMIQKTYSPTKPIGIQAKDFQNKNHRKFETRIAWTYTKKLNQHKTSLGVSNY